MDIVKIGSFISERRKKCGLTQKELAEKLGVTDKAVSKWENGRGYPDITLLPPISEALNVSVAEILNGETDGDSAKAADKLLMRIYSQRKAFLGVVSVFLIILGAFIPIYFTLFTAVMNWAAGAAAFAAGALLIVTGILIRSKGFVLRVSRIKLDLIFRPLAIVSVIAAFGLMSIEGSYIMEFAHPPTETNLEGFIEECSYFDLLPLGYGMWFPMLTAVMSAVVLILTVLLMVLDLTGRFKSGKLGRGTIICSSVAVFFSCLTVFLFSGHPTQIGFGVSLLLILGLIFNCVSASATRKN